MTHYIRTAFVFIVVVALFWLGGMEFERGGKLVVSLIVGIYCAGCAFAFSILSQDSKQ